MTNKFGSVFLFSMFVHKYLDVRGADRAFKVARLTRKIKRGEYYIQCVL